MLYENRDVVVQKVLLGDKENVKPTSQPTGPPKEDWVLC